MKKIRLTQNKFALVDDEDFNEINKFNWHFSCGYAMRREGNSRLKTTKLIQMHRQIMSTPTGMDTDHINGNKLDNRKYNLRVCNRSQNLGNSKSKGNTSIYKGVCWDKYRKKWRAEITHNYKHMRIGEFDKELHAAMAYDIAAKDLFGEFAKLNFKSVPTAAEIKKIGDELPFN